MTINPSTVAHSQNCCCNGAALFSRFVQHKQTTRCSITSEHFDRVYVCDMTIAVSSRRIAIAVFASLATYLGSRRRTTHLATMYFNDTNAAGQRHRQLEDQSSNLFLRRNSVGYYVQTPVSEDRKYANFRDSEEELETLEIIDDMPASLVVATKDEGGSTLENKMPGQAKILDDEKDAPGSRNGLPEKVENWIVHPDDEKESESLVSGRTNNKINDEDKANENGYASIVGMDEHEIETHTRQSPVTPENSGKGGGVYEYEYWPKSRSSKNRGRGKSSRKRTKSKQLKASSKNVSKNQRPIIPPR